MMLTADRDRHIADLSEQLREIEERLIPTGLHVFGRPAESAQRVDLLRMIASFDRPELGTRALTKLIADGLGVDAYEELLQQSGANETREMIDGILKAAIEKFCESGKDAAAE